MNLEQTYIVKNTYLCFFFSSQKVSISATDADEGSNAEISFSLEGGSMGLDHYRYTAISTNVVGKPT